MASNNEWVPLPPKKNGSAKKTKDNQTKVLRKLKEMFGSTIDMDIIISVAENFKWKLLPTVDTLLTLSPSVEIPVQRSNSSFIKAKPKCDPWQNQEFPNICSYTQTDLPNMNNGNFENMNQNDLQTFGETRYTDIGVSSGTYNSEPSQKVGTASLCGLKVQYRLKGTENSDDDADVVIEEESSDYRIETPEPERVNVCQFLSASTQSPPRNTFPKDRCTQVNYINTPSSQRTVQVLTPLDSPRVSSRLETDINKGYKILILMRGAPGSGKSYLARSIISRTMVGDFDEHIFSTDDYFTKTNNGVYVFDSSRIQEAHSFNYKQVLNAMRQGRSPIFVDNTNIRAWEMQNYAFIAVEYGYIVETLEPDTPWFGNVRELDRRNTHGVPKARIRTMLDRYEPNITGERLLKMFSLKYTANNKPPQLRLLPPYPTEQCTTITVNNISTESHTCQFRSPTNEDRAERLIDNENLNTIAKEYAEPEVVAENSISSSGNVIKAFNESWTEGSSYKEDSLLSEMMKLGAIGSERRVALGVNQPEHENKYSQEVSEVEGALARPRTTGADVKNNAHSLDECRDEDERKPKVMKGNSMSNCWDFTLLLNGMQIHSKFEDTFNNEISTTIDNLTKESDLKDCLAEDTEVSCILASKIDKDYSSSQDTRTSSENAIISLTELNLEDNDVQPASDILEEISTPSEKTRSSSDSSSLERVSDVDISQFEMCNTEIVDDVKTPIKELTHKDTNVEKQSTGGLGLLFSFIKNSIIGNDREKCPKQLEHQGTDTPEINDSCANQLDKLLNENSLDKASCSSTLLPDQPEVLSNDIQKTKNDTSPIDNMNTDSHINDSLLHPSSNESNNFLEAPESPQKESVMNVVKELLEASFDVEQQVEQDFLERRTATKSEELEKNFSEWMENLHIRAKSEEDENKVSKEPIHLVFGGKNIFPEKMQAQSNNSPTSNSSKSSSSSNGTGGGGGSGGGGGAGANTSNGSVANVHLINWRESPFPMDVTSLTTTAETTPVDNKLETCDRETYTDPYDFNIAYVSNNNEYKVINAVNRNINEASRHLSNDAISFKKIKSTDLTDVEEPPMQKLMLHKGTMTNTSIFLFDVDDTFTNEDQSDELIEHFPHLPRACILDVYENLCKRNYEWAFDYLNNMQFNDVIMYESLGHHDENAKVIESAEAMGSEETMQQPSNSDSSLAETTELSRQSSQPHQTHSRSKRERYRASGDLLALKQQLEEKFVMSEESYAPHTLRVKRWKRGEFDEMKPGIEAIEAHDLMSFEEQLPFMAEAPKILEPRKPSRLDHPAMEEEEEEQLTEDEDSLEDEVVEEEMLELRLGYEFIRVLESEFGSVNFQAPEGLFPVIQIRRSMAQELHALWIESVQQQLWVMQEQLDFMIAKDAEFARSLEAEEARAAPESDVPNLKEIMDMEMALATYSNDCVKQKFLKKTHNDLASHVTQQTLHEMFPGYDPAMLYEIYEAHERNFDETVKVIEENCSIKSTITMADVLKKRKNLIDELQKKSSYQTSRHNQLECLESRDEASGGVDENYANLQTYEDAVEVARHSRAEARRQLSLRNENYQKASEACRRKNPEVAAYYSDMAKLHIRNMEVANSMAASAFLAAQTHVLEADDTLDLHFLHVPEAMHALDIFLEHQLSQLAKGARKYVFIITGRGARSSNGLSKIKPVVVRKLNSKNIRFSEANPGMLKALLRKK